MKSLLSKTATSKLNTSVQSANDSLNTTSMSSFRQSPMPKASKVHTSGNIQVYCRFRPLNKREHSLGAE